MPNLSYLVNFTTRALTLAERGVHLAVLAQFAMTFVIVLAAPPARAQNEADLIDVRMHKNDYRSRIRRAHREEQRVEDQRRARLETVDRGDADQASDRAGSDKSMIDGDQDRDNRPDGSKFKTPTFQDSDFSKNNFTDLLLNSPPRAGDKGFAPADQADLSDSGDRKKDADSTRRDKDLVSVHGESKSDSTDHGKTNRKGDQAGYFDELSQLLKPPPPMGPNDWVPDKLDPITNGGFETSPDNGSPVPYRLNGHVDLERDVPWLHDQ
jgi:hypothetical protein